MRAGLTPDAKWRMLSQTAEYALRVVLHLAAQPAERLTSAAEAASRVNVPERYLSRILNALAHAGVLASTRGARGGFRLAVAPDQLSLAAVVAPFDAVGEPPQCLLRNQRCGEADPCLAHMHWSEVGAGVREFFQNTMIADLVEPAIPPVAAEPLMQART